MMRKTVVLTAFIGMLSGCASMENPVGTNQQLQQKAALALSVRADQVTVLDREGDRSAGQYHVQISNQPYLCHYQTGVSGFSTTWSVDCFQEQKAALETAAAPETPTPQPAEQQATEHAEPANKSGHQRAKSDSKGSEQASPVEEKAPVAKDQHAAVKTSAQQTAE